MAEDVSDDGAIDGRMLGRREEKDGVDTRHLPIDLGNGPLELEIGGGAKPADDVATAELTGEIDSQAVVGLDGDARLVGKDGLDEIDTLLGSEEAPLIGIDTDSDNNLVEHFKTARDDALVTDSEGVEGTGEYGLSGIWHLGGNLGSVCFFIGNES